MAKQTPQSMMAAFSNSMQARTGKTIDEWVALVQKSGIDAIDQKAVRNWLKTEHHLAQNTQWAIADAAAQAAGWVKASVDEYIDSQYKGSKEVMRPVFDRLRAIIEKLEGVHAEGRSGYIPFVRNRQFLAIEVPNRTKVILGLRFTSEPPSRKFESCKGPGQSTHRIFLESIEDITPEIEKLIQLAYEQN
ncbi:MAG: DUF5655 domain-containing protein [Anaerolineaceae bacterium]|jgi:predicted transport protein